MTVATTNGKLAIMELDQDWEPGIPLSPGSFNTANQQQLVWGYPDIAWGDSLYTPSEELQGFFVPPDLIPPPVYDIILRSPFGDYIMNLNNYITLELARRVNAEGSLELEVFLKDNISRRLSSDCKIEIWRVPFGGGAVLEGDTVWIVRGYEQVSSSSGRTLTIAASDTISLLNRRYIMYPSGSPQASKSGYADDLMKEIIYENMGEGAFGVYRNISDYIVIDNNQSLAPTVEKSFAYLNMLSVLQSLADLSRQNGIYLSFDLVYHLENVLKFKTYINQRGSDKRWNATNPNSVILSESQGSLSDVAYSVNWDEEVTAVYAGGQGLGEDRTVSTAFNTSRLGYSPFGYIELFRNATHLSNANSIAYEAESLLNSYTVLRKFRAKAVQTPSSKFGTHYNFGDYISVYHDQQVFHTRVEAYSRKLSNGRDEIDVALEGELE